MSSWVDFEAREDKWREPYVVALEVEVLATSSTEAEHMAEDPGEWQQSTVIEAKVKEA